MASLYLVVFIFKRNLYGQLNIASHSAVSIALEKDPFHSIESTLSTETPLQVVLVTYKKWLQEKHFWIILQVTEWFFFYTGDATLQSHKISLMYVFL